jgi:Ca2+-transporting ATPase
MSHKLDIQNLTGLSEAEAAKRLRSKGYNELPTSKRRGISVIAFDVIREPMFLLLVACGTLYLILGDIEEALMLLSFVFVVMGITLYQERKTERALEALRDLSSPRALVIRDGVEKRIAGRDVVPGDIIVVQEGDRVPADATLLSSLSLSIDESLLTGESVPVWKSTISTEEKMPRPGGDNLPFIFASTLVVQGQGIAKVQATGTETEIGRIGKALQTVKPEETQLKKETGKLVSKFALAGFLLCIFIVVIYGLSRQNWLEGFLAGITLAMAILPEEFPVVLTIFLALGAWRIAQKQVLTRRLPAVETLGSATVLCVDKTGTLTMNRMSISTLFTRGEFFQIAPPHSEMPETFHELAEFSILASQIDPFDPMEKAIKRLGEIYLARTEHLHQDWSLVHEYPLSKELLSLSRVWKSTSSDQYIIAAKGAPEAIADLCHFTAEQNQELAGYIHRMADDGLRVLGVARANFEHRTLPGEQHDFTFEFVGLIGLADPIRPAVPHAISECYRAGIRVIMITGDYPGTAQNIARQIGLVPNDQFISGLELDHFSEQELRERIKKVSIFARVVPEQKLRLVKALKANGEIVAMTGDGVNDAPALKAAHIGVAMGERGTDVARESADLVLLDDDFSSIVRAVRLGRRIFDNIKKAIAYIFAIHVPIAGLSLIPVLFKWPLILMPVHIVFLELIIDPACSTVFEAESEEADLMHRPPRDPREPLFSRRTLTLSLMQGVIVLIIMLSVFNFSFSSGHDADKARVMTFATLIFANLGLIMTNRSWSRTMLETLRSPNIALWLIFTGTLLFLGSVLYLPFLRSAFRFSALHPHDLIVCLIAGFMSILWFEALKIANKIRKKTSGVQEC